jgi:hypothetical protein
MALSRRCLPPRRSDLAATPSQKRQSPAGGVFRNLAPSQRLAGALADAGACAASSRALPAGAALSDPTGLYADRAYDHETYRKAVHAKGIRPYIARRGQAHGSGLGVVRWVVERSIAWYHGMKRLRIRWERRDDIHEAFLALATWIITYRHGKRLC